MIRTAVIGFGLSARVFHLPFIATSPAFCLVGISTSQPDAAMQWPDVVIYPDASTLLAQTDASLIVITAPNRAHFALAKAALLAGKDVLVEKPLAVSVAEARELQLLAATQQRRLAVFHNRRFDDDFLAVQELVGSGQLGDVQLMYARFDRFRPQVQPRWKESAEPGNGVLYDLAPHLLDQAIALFGKPDALTAQCRCLRQHVTTGPATAAAVDYFQLTLHYHAKTGAKTGANTDGNIDAISHTPARELQLSSSPYCAHPALRFELQGSRGSFRSHGLDPQEQLLRDALLQSTDSNAVFASNAWQQRQQGRCGDWCDGSQTRIWPFPPSDYGRFYQQLALHLTEHGPAPVPLQDAILGLQLIELALQSSLEQRTLPVL